MTVFAHLVDPVERGKKVVALRDSGQKYKEIAYLFGVSPSRVQHMYHAHKAREKRKARWQGCDLSPRARNCLYNEFFHVVGHDWSKSNGNEFLEVMDAIRQRIGEGDITEARLSRVPNLGKKSLAEIMVWAKGEE